MYNIVEAIDKEASTLPPEFQREVLDFIGYLHTKSERKSELAWLERAWGAAPDFPNTVVSSPMDQSK